MPVGYKLPELFVDWLVSPSQLDKSIIDRAVLFDKDKMWNMVTIPAPCGYPNVELYFIGHLDNENTPPDIVHVPVHSTDG